jgi:hypothetical protein
VVTGGSTNPPGGGTGSATGSGSQIGTGTGAVGVPGTGGATGSGGAGVTPPITPITGSTTTALCEQQRKESTALRLGRTLLRRMTRSQFNHTVRDLLQVEGGPASGITLDERVGPFFNNAIAPITDLIVRQHEEAAVRIAAEAATRMSTISPCDLAADTGTTCAGRFIDELGRKAYRRPLDATERAAYLALYTTERGQGTAQSAFTLVVETMLQSPYFLYHVDGAAIGTTPTGAPVRLRSHELASRLSYFLWDTMPDKALFDLATADRLQDDAVLAAEVERMLADGKAADAVPMFHLQWLGIGEMNGVSKDAQRFPQFNTALVDAMLAETAAFTDFVVRRGDGLMRTLLTASFSFPSGGLFQIYGVAQPAGFRAGDQVPLPRGQRAGVLTQAAFLATHAHPDQSSPVHRGIKVRENLLCQPLGSPPPEVDTDPPPVTETTTTRERFAAHVALASCAVCHTLIDPIGLGFENYDAVGAYRTKEGQKDVDASGQVIGGSGSLGGTFVGAVELAGKLADSRQASDCLANQWFRFGLGRMEAPDDACSLASIQDGFVASGGNIRQLLTKIVQSDAFRYMRSTGEMR